MDALQSPITTPLVRDTSTQTRLSGRWLLLARFVWIVIVALGIWMYVTALPILYASLRVTCDADLCISDEQLRSGEVATFQGLGISLNTYAAYWTILQAGPSIILVGVAIFIFLRRSDERMALLASLMLTMLAVSIAPTTDSLVAIQPIWRWPQMLVQVLGFGTFIIFFYVFPDGRFVPGWTRWLALIWLVFVAWSALGGKLLQNFLFFPIGFTIGFASAVAAQVYRYRNISTPVQRQQTKWVVVCLAAMFIGGFIGFIPLLAVPTIREGGTALRLYNFFIRIPVFAVVPISFLPLGIVFSLLRYRLWDVDFIINRGLVYAGLTALLLILFGASLLGVTQIFQDFAGGPLVAVAVAAAVFGAVFSPAQKALRRVVDQRFYGIQLDYLRAFKVDGDADYAPKSIDRALTAFGTYTGLTLLGRGGMGEVYRAEHPTLNRSIAIKILPPHADADSHAHKRFYREAQTVARLKHPNIVTLHDVGEQDGHPFMVMEYIDGPDLSNFLKQRGKLPFDEALPLLEDIAAALDYAHSQGIIHRDVKPSNVMVEHITGSGRNSSTRAVLMDFGIAKSYAAGTRLTQSGMIGTLDYISPEQIQGASDVDGRADIYSFGVMTYQMLTGEMPFKYNNPGAMVMAHLMQPPPDPRSLVPDLPDEVAEAILRAMAKKPEVRFATAGQFISALAENSHEMALIEN